MLFPNAQFSQTHLSAFGCSLEKIKTVKRSLPWMGLYDLRNIKTAPWTHRGHFWGLYFCFLLLRRSGSQDAKLMFTHYLMYIKLPSSHEFQFSIPTQSNISYPFSGPLKWPCIQLFCRIGKQAECVPWIIRDPWFSETKSDIVRISTHYTMTSHYERR